MPVIIIQIVCINYETFSKSSPHLTTVYDVPVGHDIVLNYINSLKTTINVLQRR